MKQKKKRILLVSFSENANYGGTLQEFALYCILKDQGNAICLRYIDPIIKANSKPVRTALFTAIWLNLTKKSDNQIKVKSKNKNQIFFYIREGINQIYILFNDIIYLNQRKKLIETYHCFWNKYLKQSPAYNLNQLLNHKLKAFDIYISGSDQIWNPLKFGLNPVYYLAFAEENHKKISYASSFGNYEFHNKYDQRIKEYLSSFQAVSVREENNIPWLNQQLAIKTSCVLDPTLLLTKEMWLKKLNLNIKPAKSNYIAVYMLGDRRRILQLAYRVSKKLNLPLYVLDNPPLFTTIKNTIYHSAASPEKFISLFANASYVVTNSFHGTAFAVNFGIPFISVESNLPKRQISLLTKVGLMDQYWKKKDCQLNEITDFIDFTLANKQLESERKHSMDYLRQALKESVIP